MSIATLLQTLKVVVPTRNARELAGLLISALCFLCVLASYYVLRPIREQFASAAGGSQILPTLYTLVFIAMLVLAPVYGAIASRFPRRIFVPVIYVFFIACLLAMGPFLRYSTDQDFDAKFFYVWVSVFNLFVVAVFWSCMTDFFSPEQAKRLYGLLALGGTSGALLGPLMAKAFVLNIGLDGLYLLAAFILALALLALLILFAGFTRTDVAAQSNPAQALGGSVWDGALATFRHPLMRRMALLLLCADGVGTILHSNLSDYARQTISDPLQRTAFFATIDLWSNSLQVLLQLFVVRWALSGLGAGKTMAIPNLLSALMLVIVAIYADASLIALALIATRGGGYGMVNPARESVFTGVSSELRFKAKAFIDTAVWRGGDLLMVTLVSVLVQAGAGVGIFGLLAALVALIAVYLSWNVEQLSQDSSKHQKSTV